MKRTLLIMLIVLAVITGLVFLAAYTGSTAKMKEKRPTAIPSISIDPYRIPLPIMEHNVEVAVKAPVRAN